MYNFVNYCTFQATLQELGSDKWSALVTNLIHIISIKLKSLYMVHLKYPFISFSLYCDSTY